VQVRGGFGSAVEVDIVDDAAMEVTAKRDVTYQAGVGIEGEIEFEITLAACCGGGGGDTVVDADGATCVASEAGDDVHDAIVCNDTSGVLFAGENMVTVEVNRMTLASALSEGVSCSLHGQWGGTKCHAVEGGPGREIEQGLIVTRLLGHAGKEGKEIPMEVPGVLVRGCWSGGRRRRRRRGTGKGDGRVGHVPGREILPENCVSRVLAFFCASPAI
jgi:hypothetical protein